MRYFVTLRLSFLSCSVMKKAIYFSAFSGIFFVLISVFGSKYDLEFIHLLLPLGIGLLLVVAFPLLLIDYFDRSKKINQPKNCEPHDKKTRASHSSMPTKKKSIKGYPTFSQRKSGLEWGGGNIHGSSAKRGSKRGFLRH